MSGPAQNVAAIQTAWTQAKADLATAKATLATLQTNLGTLEGDCDTLYSLGANDVADWLRTQIRQAAVGYLPRISAGGNQPPQLVAVQAPDTTHARDLSSVDQRPIGITSTAQLCGLS